ncbi:SpoIIE family protein phosphatase [Opitutus sp. ER46]|uniref:SpoIIE family protein phosphatase n=1 Tax=Opitutus sp. ER46 TaxID=2161864 RepID=UPI001304E083|nr:SpoIIE family protein phosphatase [Opitutus sp. ER46]
MDRLPHQNQDLVWSVSERTRAGEAVSGDRHLVAPTRDGVLIAVIDGLGHGEEATRAAERARAVLTAQPEADVAELVRQCHEALRDTRGAVMTLLSLRPAAGVGRALGVGNVEVVLVRADPQARPARETLLLRNGVVGYQLPALQVSELAVGPGDVIVLATDGVRGSFADDVTATIPPAELAEQILARHYGGTDDALVLAGRVGGGA